MKKELKLNITKTSKKMLTQSKGNIEIQWTPFTQLEDLKSLQMV